MGGGGERGQHYKYKFLMPPCPPAFPTGWAGRGGWETLDINSLSNFPPPPCPPAFPAGLAGGADGGNTININSPRLPARPPSRRNGRGMGGQYYKYKVPIVSPRLPARPLSWRDGRGEQHYKYKFRRTANPVEKAKFCFARTCRPPTAVGRTKHMTSICAKLPHRPQRSESDAQCNAMQCDHTDCCRVIHDVYSHARPRVIHDVSPAA